MKALFVLIALGLIVAVGFLFAFIWNVKTEQFEDSYTPSVRILFDEEPINIEKPIDSFTNKK